MAQDTWQPSERAVERKAEAMCKTAWPDVAWSDIFGSIRIAFRRLARAVLTEQHEREAPLVKALRASSAALFDEGGWEHTFALVNKTLIAHARLDAEPEPEPTLLECVERITNRSPKQFGHAPDGIYEFVLADEIAALRAAYERERAK